MPIRPRGPAVIALAATAVLVFPLAAQETIAVRTRIDATKGEPRPLLADPGFEGGAEEGGGWTLHPAATSLDEHVAHEGNRSLRIATEDPWADTGATQTIALDPPVAKPLRLRAAARAEYVPQFPGEGYAVTVELEFADGRPAAHLVLPFPPGPHEWLVRETFYVPPAAVRAATVRAHFWAATGTVWFDDVSLDEFDLDWDTARVDGEAQLVVAAPLSEAEKASAHRLATADGSLALDLTAAGRIGRLELVRTNYADPLSQPASGFTIRERDGRETWAVALPVRGKGESARQQGELAALGVAFDAGWTAGRDRIDVSVSLEDRRGKDRALTVAFALPIDATGWTWCDSLRGGRPVSADGETADLRWVGAGASGRVSAFPAAVVAGSSGIALWLPADRPSLARLVYRGEAHELAVAFDVALAWGAVKQPGHATFSFSFAAVPAAHGLRAAVARMHADLPAVFGERKGVEGGGAVLERLGGALAKDFGVQYSLLPWSEGIGDVSADDKAGVQTLWGVEPVSAALPADAPATTAAAAEGLIAGCLDAELPEDADENQRIALAIQQAAAQVARSCGVLKLGGEPCATWLAPPLAWFLVNPDPDLQGPGPYRNKSELAWSARDVAPLYKAGRRGALDGHWVAALETAAEALDFRPQALAAADGPPAFDAVSGRPCVLLGCALHEFFGGLAGELHRQKRPLFGHGPVAWAWWLAAPFDGLVLECPAPPEAAGNAYAGWETTLLRHAALAGRRPLIVALSDDYNRVKRPAALRFLHACAAIGAWPSWGRHVSDSGGSETVWNTPAWTEPLKADTKAAHAIVRELRQAGWQPVTGVVADATAVRVERFGEHARGTLALTAFNPTGDRVDTILRLDAALLGLPAAGWKVRDRAGGAPLTPRVAGPGEPVPMAVELAPGQLRVLVVRRG